MTPKKLYFVLIGLIALLLGGAGVGGYFVDGKIRAAIKEHQQTLAQIDGAEDQADKLKQLALQYDRLKTKLGPVEEALPRTKNQSEIILQLQKIATDSGMSIPSASFTNASAGLPNNVSQTVKAGDAVALPISFQLTGSYAQLQTFLQKQEALGRYTNVTALSISKNASNSLTFGITINAYFKP